MYQAIQTNYKGTNFRSKLEVRWARFFDAVGWKWKYEPYRINRWLPDFEIKTFSGRCFVEVKPFINFNVDAAGMISGAIGEDSDGYLITSDVELLLLSGDILKQYDDCGDEPNVIGWLHDGEQWARAILIEPTYGRIGFYHELGGWHCRITGLYDGDAYILPPKSMNIRQTWNECGGYTPRANPRTLRHKTKRKEPILKWW